MFSGTILSLCDFELGFPRHEGRNQKHLKSALPGSAGMFGLFRPENFTEDQNAGARERNGMCTTASRSMGSPRFSAG